jgi:hypothetical protein
MNKKFYFALALTAGLFASCSSDDLAEAPGLNVDQSNDAAAIKIEVAKPNATTRGTGAVGVEANKWEGQDFQLFMFEKGTLNLATYEDETHAMVPIFDNYNMTTRKDGTGSADYWIADPADPTNTVIQYNYFPTSGSYSFWGYRADDAAAAYKLVKDDGTDAADASEAATVRVPVTINGTQDLMIAETKESDAATQLKGVVTTLSDDEAAAKIYSAYAARRGVNPKLQFSHLLSRIYFEVEAGDRDVSDAATIKTTDPNEYAGFRITSVKVKSKSKGYIVAAYKDAIPADAQRLVWDDGDGDPTNDETWPAATADDAKTRWNAETTLAEFELKSREKVVDEPAQVALVSRSLGAADFTIPATYDFGSGAVAVADAGSVIAFGDDTPVYTANTLDGTTGLPTTAPVTRKTLLDGGHLGTETIYYLIVRDGVHDGTTVAWNKPTYTEDPSQLLKPTLDEVTPEWTGYTPETKGVPTWRELVQAATLYTWTEQPGYAVVGGEVDLGADTEPSTDPAVAGVYALNDVVFTDWGGVNRYFKLTAIAYNTDGALDVVDHTALALTTADIDTKKVHNTTDGKYYEVYGVGGAAEVKGNAVATPIGESLLVAPNDETGHYLIEIGFKRTKKVTSTKVQELNGTAYLAPAVTSGKFEAGKSYKITLVLYSDGEIKSEGYTIINWTDGTGDLTEPKYEL